MAAEARWRLAALPFIGRRQLREHAVPAAGGDERKAADGRPGIPGCADEAGVLVLCHGTAADEEFVDVHTMDRAFILFGVLGAHQELARGDMRQIGSNRKGHRVRAGAKGGRAPVRHASPKA
jgi:hypothetical protein